MQPAVSEFLARQTPFSEEKAIWGNGTIHLTITGYFSDEFPPEEYITSVRSLVFRDDCILVLTNRDERHIVPGGRREANESLEETLRREVLEESGWAIMHPRLLAVIHLHHTSPKPPDYPYPYPDFFQLIYISDAGIYHPESIMEDDYELHSAFYPIDEARKLLHSEGYLLLLDKALELRVV